MHIYLVRHGRKRRDQSRFTDQRFDPDLTKLGSQQADLTGKRLSSSGIERVYASNLARTVQTAEIANQHIGAPMALRPELREIFMGDWEGTPFTQLSDLNASYYEAWKQHTTDLPYPNGESGSQVFFRANHVLREIVSQTTEAALIVTHGGVIRCLVSGVIGLAMEKRYNLHVHNCSITSLYYNPEGQRFSLEYLNDTSHLTALNEKSA